jgi:hypothetical protein
MSNQPERQKYYASLGLQAVEAKPMVESALKEEFLGQSLSFSFVSLHLSELSQTKQ